MNKRELRRVVTEFRQGILDGGDPDMMCYAVCAPLQSYLGFLGCHTQMVEADFGRSNHYWLELPDGTIIDPTASQFSGPTLKLPKVYVGPVPEIYKKWIADVDQKRSKQLKALIDMI